MDYEKIYKRANEIHEMFEIGELSRDEAIGKLSELKRDAEAHGKVFEFSESDLVDDSVETGEEYYEESEEYEESSEYFDDEDFDDEESDDSI